MFSRAAAAQFANQRTKDMKHPPSLLVVSLIAALSFCLPITASAQSSKSKSASPSPTATGSPAAAETSDAKPPRAIPFRGTVSEVDSSAKTFTIAGKTASRVFKVTDKTTITKDGAEATFADIEAEGKVTGSYWKRDDGTLEAKTVKIGSASASDKPAKKKKKSKKAADEEEVDEADASASPSSDE